MGRLYVIHGVLVGVVSGFIQSATRLAGVRALANLAIFAASLSITLRLLSLTRSRFSLGSATRLVVSLLVLTGVTGAAQVGAFLGVPRPGEPAPTLLKVLAGVLWVVAAVRLSDFTAVPVVSPPTHSPARAAWIAQLNERARALERLVGNDAWLLGKTEALQELREIRAELEIYQCKI
jgi:hypothetical protein